LAVSRGTAAAGAVNPAGSPSALSEGHALPRPPLMAWRPLGLCLAGVL